MKGYILSGTAFVLAIVVIISVNYLLLVKAAEEKSFSQNLIIDSVYNTAVDMQRILATDSNNTFADALSDAAYAHDCSWLNTSSNIQTQLQTYITTTFSRANTVLSPSGISVTSGDLDLTKVSSSLTNSTHCTLQYTAVFSYSVQVPGQVVKNAVLNSTKTLIKAGSTIIINDNTKGTTDFSK